MPRRSARCAASNRYDDTFIHERKPFSWPGGKTLAIWIAPNVEVWHYDSAGRHRHLAQSHQPRARRRQLRLAGIRHAGRALAHGGRARRRRRQGDGRAQFAGLRRASEGRRGNEEARLGVHGPRHHEQREPRRPRSRKGEGGHRPRAQDDRRRHRPTAARLARHRAHADPQHARHPGRGGRDLLRRLEQRRPAVSA